MNVSAPQTHGLAFFSDKEKEKGVWFFLFLFFCKQKKALQFGKMKEAVVSPPPIQPVLSVRKMGNDKNFKTFGDSRKSHANGSGPRFSFLFASRSVRAQPLPPSPHHPPVFFAFLWGVSR